MRKAVIGPRARADVRGIWRYTNDKHGPGAADAYIHDLDQAIQLVREFPHLGTDCADVRTGYRRMRSGSHLIYYIGSETELHVIRILHERQDPKTNL